MSTDTALPEQIGPYRVLRLLGEGAMGRVVLAQQQQPERPVALKLLRGAAALPDVRARFAREARLLALLEHPNIARLYAADVADTPLGPQPYLAMEYVPGADLLSHARALPLRDKLALLVTVCKAVHFAHTRGVIHRDLKPANLLVDAHGQPKVLDFGIAHVMDGEGQTSLTRAGEVLGTLPYMSWEQLGGEAAALDPRSDVFALGVIGYELVAGLRPYPMPALPSLTAVLEQRRKSAPQRLSSHLPEARGDLETILHKAMAFEARDRYESAADLAGDLQRYLDFRPIEARPPTATYVMSRFMRRHRGLSAALGVALLSLVAASVVSTRFAFSEQAARLQEAEARSQAESRSAELRAVNQFLEDALATPDPMLASPDAPRTLEGFLANTEKVLATDLSVPPLVAAQLYKTLGSTQHSLERYPQALALFEKARERLSAAPQGSAQEPLLGIEIEALHAIAKGETGDRDEALQTLLKLRAQLPPATGEAQRLRMVLAGHIADQQLARSDYAAVIALLREAVAESEATLAKDDLYTLFNVYRLAYALRLAGDNDEAVRLQQGLLERARGSLGPRHPLTAATLNEIALLQLSAGNFAEAETVLRELGEINVGIYGPQGLSTLAAQGNLVNALLNQKKWDEATTLGKLNLEGARAAQGAESRVALMAERNLARGLAQTGQAAEAERLFRHAIAGLPKVMGDKHPEAFKARHDLGQFLLDKRRSAEALALYRRLHADSVAVFGPDNFNVAVFETGHAQALYDLGQPEEARQRLERARPILLSLLKPTHPRVQKADALLARLGAPAAGAAP